MVLLELGHVLSALEEDESGLEEDSPFRKEDVSASRLVLPERRPDLLELEEVLLERRQDPLERESVRLELEQVLLASTNVLSRLGPYFLQRSPREASPRHRVSLALPYRRGRRLTVPLPGSDGQITERDCTPVRQSRSVIQNSPLTPAPPAPTHGLTVMAPSVGGAAAGAAPASSCPTRIVTTATAAPTPPAMKPMVDTSA